MTELKPCDFCGSNQVFMHGHRSSASWVECRDCAASGPVAADADKAARLWNTRSYDGLVGELVEAFQATICAYRRLWIENGQDVAERSGKSYDEESGIRRFSEYGGIIRADAALTRAREAGYGDPAKAPNPGP